MDFPNVFTAPVAEQLVARINNLKPDSKPQWGKMNVSEMLAHCSVSYEMVYTDKHPTPSPFLRFVLKVFVKNAVTGPKPYKRNSPTGPQFKISGMRDFETEKTRLCDYIRQMQQLGEADIEKRESLSFGKITVNEWNTMFYKHLNHHLVQFGV